MKGIPRSDAARTDSTVAPTLERKLLAYMVAAAGVVSLSSVANAEIVYTPANVTISQGTLQIDLDADGTNDFAVNVHSSFGFDGNHVHAARIFGDGNGGAAVIARKYAEALHEGFAIGPASPIRFANVQSHAVSMAYARCGCYSSFFYAGGYWKDVNHKYLGLQFLINGQVHYGWARFNVQTQIGSITVTATLTGYAYETQPNTTIIAGDTGPSAGSDPEKDSPKDSSTQATIDRQIQSLGLLSLGVLGLNAR